MTTTLSEPATPAVEDEFALLAKNFEDAKKQGLVKKEEFLTIDLYRNFASIDMGGSRKSISLPDFKKVLDEILKVETDVMESLMLPFGCFAIAKSFDKLQLSIYRPGEKREIKHQDGRGSKATVYSIPFPNTVISFGLNKVEGNLWQLNTEKYFITPAKVPKLPTDNIYFQASREKHLYHLPLSNIYEDDRMCYGGNTTIRRYTNNLRGLDYFYDLLFVSEFNNDLGIRGIDYNKLPSSISNSANIVSAWYKHLSTLETFPYEVLTGYKPVA